MENSHPLVSIIVISYNSEHFILETLESVLSQTYKNIELIISDDASTDRTVALSKEWIEQNKSRFLNAKIIQPEKNTGIAGNCNRGVRASEGEWIKLMAADDLLLPNCIEDSVAFAKKNQSKVILGNVIHFLDGTNPKKILKRTKPYWGKAGNPKTANEQYQALLLNYCGNTVSLFFARSVYDKIPYDERFQFIEDYPFLMNVTKNNIFIDHLDKETAMYRVRNHSVYFDDPDKLFSDFYKKRLAFDREYRFPYISKMRRKSEEYRYKRLELMNKWNLNKQTPWSKFVFAVSRLFNINKYLMHIFDRKNL